MNKRLLWSIAGGAIVVISIIAGLYQYKRQHTPVQEVPAVAAPAAPPPDERGAIQNPLPAQQTEPLPALDDSDVPFHQQLLILFGAALDEILIPEGLVRHVVASIDNLPRKKLAVQLRPVKPAPGKFLTSGDEDHLTLDPANSARYKAFIKLVQNADPQQVVALYLRYYPLLQQAYQSLGNSTSYFNDRVIEAIDDLLATPDLDGPIRLAQPNVFYEFAERNLEDRSAGQKLLLRMGKDNAAIIKAKLRDIRRRIATTAPRS